MADRLWKVRDAVAGDRTGILCLWMESFWSSSYGREFRHVGGKHDYWLRHEPRVKRYITRSRILVACDVLAPEVICAFAALEGDDVLHYLMAKRCYHRAGESVAMWRELLGKLLTDPCTHTHELPELQRAEVRAAGFVRPSHWVYDPYVLEDRRAA